MSSGKYESCDNIVILFTRLQFFAQGCQIYIRQIKLALEGKKGPALQEEENKIKVAALRTTNNINTIIKVSRPV